MPRNPIYILFLIFYTPCCLLTELNNVQQPHQEYTEELGLSVTREASLLPEFNWYEVHINFPSLIEEAGLIWLLYFLLQRKTVAIGSLFPSGLFSASILHMLLPKSL